jgi:hypothetical protein
MKTAILLLLSASLLAGGCEKEKIYVPFCNPYKYFPLDIGNYWIYRNYATYRDGNIEERGVDSMYISSDTLMLGNRYFHLTGTFHLKPISRYLTYSNGRVISTTNSVYFECPQLSGNDKIYPIMDFDFPGTLKTTRMDTLLSVPAGDFDPVMLFEAHSMLDDTLWIVTYQSYYAKNVGLVKFSAHQHPNFDTDNISELVRYHIGK